ncbi:MAG: hypothetical protein ACFCUS_11825 [Rubrimonas sp.]
MKTLISATAALALLAAPAFAQSMRDARGKADDAVKEANDASGRVVALTGALNGQINLGDVTSELTVVAEKTGDAAATAAAIGNSLSATVDAADFGGLATRALQVNGGDVTASLNGELSDVNGEVSATSAAIGNSASLSVASAAGAIGSTVGQANKGDVAAVADVAVREARNAVSVTAAAIGNSISIVNGVAE